jgi:hypothetical protein
MGITESQKADNLSNRVFAQDLLIEFKQKNITEGMNAPQALWLHHRTRAWDVNFMGKTYTVDLMNMCQSGDLETVYISLAYGIIDDMSQSYHWLNQTRVDFLKNAISKQLGWS